MSPPAHTTRDEDGVRTSTGEGRAATSARLLGIVLVAAALAVIAASAGAVWWLRRDPGAHPAVEVATKDGEPPQRIAAHAVRAIVMLPTPAAAAQPTAAMRTQPAKRSANPVRGAPGGRAVTSAPAAPGDTIPNPATDPAAEDQPGAEAARAQQRDDGEIAKMAQDVINGMRAAGETRGLAAIPPPGTNPVKTGVVVPKDFELPEGYVRHYQTTDDGKRLEPILMFSPDYEFLDDQGKPLALPKDGIVPPEMVPPGMPVRKLEIPAAARQTNRGEGR